MPVNGSDAGLYGLDEDSRRMVVDTVRRLKDRLLNRETVLGYDKQDIFPEDAVREMLGPDIGLQLLFIPEEYGGMGGGARDCCVVTSEMSKICLGVATAFFAIQLGADPIIVGATEDQKEKWLGRIAEGNSIVAYAVTEPEAGSNVAAITTRAEPLVNDRNEVTAYKINGTKQFISNGGYADFITLLAKTPEGPSFFIVERGAEGFRSGKPEEKHGIRASNTSPVSLSDMVVPIENLIGGVPGQGLKQANMVFGYTRLMVGAMALGAARSALDIAVRYAKERIQFGTPLAEKQGYTHKLIVSNAVRIEAAEAYIEAIAERIDSGETDLQVEGSIAKLFASESADKTANDAIQALGGYGYIHEFEVEKIKRDVKITCIYEGASEIQQNIISTFRWKKTRKSKGAFYGRIREEMLQADVLRADAGGAYLARAAGALNKIITLIHEQGLVKKQFVMFMVADMAAHVEVCEGLARKSLAHMAGDNSGGKKLQLCARLFARETLELVILNCRRILSGAGVFDKETVRSFLEMVLFDETPDAWEGFLSDMDELADILFER